MSPTPLARRRNALNLLLSYMSESDNETATCLLAAGSFPDLLLVAIYPFLGLIISFDPVLTIDVIYCPHRPAESAEVC